MSSAPDDIDKSAFFRGSAKFDSDEEALQSLAEMKNLDFGDYFTSRDTNLNDDEAPGISLTFYHDEKSNHLSLSTESDSELNITIHLVNEDVEFMGNILSEIMSEVGAVVQNEVYALKEYDIPFGALNTPIDRDSNLEITGLNIKLNGKDVIIQGREERDAIAVQLQDEEEKEYVDEVTETFFDEYFELIDELIEGDLLNE